MSLGFDDARRVKRVIGTVLILTGGWLLYSGYRQADSLAGRTRTTITDLKNSVDGKSRVPPQYWYYGGGVLLIGAGLMIGLRRQS